MSVWGRKCGSLYSSPPVCFLLSPLHKNVNGDVRHFSCQTLLREGRHPPSLTLPRGGKTGGARGPRLWLAVWRERPPATSAAGGQRARGWARPSAAQRLGGWADDKGIGAAPNTGCRRGCNTSEPRHDATARRHTTESGRTGGAPRHDRLGFTRGQLYYPPTRWRGAGIVRQGQPPELTAGVEHLFLFPAICGAFSLRCGALPFSPRRAFSCRRHHSALSVKLRTLPEVALTGANACGLQRCKPGLRTRFNCTGGPIPYVAAVLSRELPCCSRSAFPSCGRVCLRIHGSGMPSCRGVKDPQYLALLRNRGTGV